MIMSVDTENIFANSIPILKENRQSQQRRKRREVPQSDKSIFEKTLFNTVLIGERLNAFLLRSGKRRSSHIHHYTGSPGQ